MPKDNYVYAVTRVHNHEQGLLSGTDMEALVAAKDAGEVFRLLNDKGWGDSSLPANDADALVAFETKRTWELIGELAGELEPFKVFRYGNDYHNLKAAIKLAYTGSEDAPEEQYFLPFGTVDIETLQKAAAEHDFSALPEEMAAAGKEAYEALAHTGSGQMSDMAIDRAALLAIDKAGKAAGSELLRRYAQLTVDVANIKAAVRCCGMGKDKDFIQKAVAPAGTLDTGRLVEAASESMEAVYAFLSLTSYSGAVEALKTSLSAFERWCDDQLMEMIRPQRNAYFGIEPLAAYLLGRENEIRMVRLILSAKQNHLDDAVLRERLRVMYV